MSRTATVLITAGMGLRCQGPHPYAARLPEKFGGRKHDVQVGFPVPFACKATGRVWTAETEPLPGNDGRIMIQVRCQCGAVTEYEVVSPDAE